MNKKQIIHIGGGESWLHYDNYISYLKTVEVSIGFSQNSEKRWYKKYHLYLDKNKFEIIQLTMPCKQNAHYSEWKIWFERHILFMRENIIFVGYSLGGNFLAKYLSENVLPISISQLHLIAPSYSTFENDFKIKEFPKNFFQNEIKEIHIYHSKDDTIVPLSESEKYTAVLNEAKFHIFLDRGHFFGEDFPELFVNIKK